MSNNVIFRRKFEKCVDKQRLVMYNEINKRKQANLNKNKRKRGKVHQRKINKL